MSKTVVLTFDDACRSHLEFVAPLLREYGFGATFFVCRPENWLAKDPEAFLSGPEIGELYRAGFETGNHTLNHICLEEADEEQGRGDIAGLNALTLAIVSISCVFGRRQSLKPPEFEFLSSSHALSAVFQS